MEKLVPVQTTYSAAQAELIKQDLESEGIPCMLDNLQQAGMAGVFPIRILVQESDAARAREWIEARHGG